MFALGDVECLIMDRSRRQVKAPNRFMTSEDLITEVRKRPALWDESLSEYRDRLLKRTLWQQIADLYVAGSPNDCQKSWLNLRKALSNHRNHWERKHGKSGAAAAVYKPYKYESLMSFLNNFNGTDDMDGNLDSGVIGNGNGDGDEVIDEDSNNDDDDEVDDDDDNEDEDSENSPQLSGVEVLPSPFRNIDKAPFRDLTNKKFGFVKDSTQRKLFITPKNNIFATPQNTVSFMISPPSSPSRKKTKLVGLTEDKENGERIQSKTPLKKKSLNVEKSVVKTPVNRHPKIEESKKARKERLKRERQAELEKNRESVVKTLKEEVSKAEAAQSMWDSDGNRREATPPVSCSIDEAIIRELQRDDDSVTLFLGITQGECQRVTQKTVHQVSAAGPPSRGRSEA
ncbi:Replicase polyprotein 1a [Frankliniella fusca]|uniref:Replicase polyprotein 1a n=1 Tax=Frankliniella fusca TaxID=407009 RepID=A0AAE1LCQ3_9NEOP|nr:Replicase polyprotein 1a [Frankliniella fusca]